MGLDAGWAGIRRLLRPLERLGVDAADNAALFRFLGRCATIPGISKLDHCTFVTPFEHTEQFLTHWASQGFAFHGEWRTIRYPARHIALVRGRPSGFPWEEMVGLTVSDDPGCPIHRTMPPLRDHFALTHQLQHIAINIAPDADMHAVRSALEAMGVRFMTPVLSYDDGSGAGLPPGSASLASLATRGPTSLAAPAPLRLSVASCSASTRS
jgi:hypothetical protein